MAQLKSSNSEQDAAAVERLKTLDKIYRQIKVYMRNIRQMGFFLEKPSCFKFGIESSTLYLQDLLQPFNHNAWLIILIFSLTLQLKKAMLRFLDNPWSKRWLCGRRPNSLRMAICRDCNRPFRPPSVYIIISGHNLRDGLPCSLPCSIVFFVFFFKLCNKLFLAGGREREGGGHTCGVFVFHSWFWLIFLVRMVAVVLVAYRQSIIFAALASSRVTIKKNNGAFRSQTAISAHREGSFKWSKT